MSIHKRSDARARQAWQQGTSYYTVGKDRCVSPGLLLQGESRSVQYCEPNNVAEPNIGRFPGDFGAIAAFHY